mmetsp:Transcript_25854/g.38297  ORF Transcript_25854/g.38297 Transcript_25854/m.38297 type:complete len:121 (+) Transcript_25854:1388-1750(+)
MDMNHAIREENIMRAFQQFDKDGSGSLTMNELIEIMGSEDHARELVGEIDLNGDGVISYEEFKAMMQGLNTHSARYRALMGESDHPDALSNDADAKLSISEGASQEKKKASKNFFSRSKK